MRGERWLLRAGEWLAGRAARHLPPATRDQRYQEWVAELPVIFNDPDVRPAVIRAARMLWFATDTLRGAILRPGPACRCGAHRGGTAKTARLLGALTCLPVMVAAGLAIVVFLAYQALSGGDLAADIAYFLSFFLTLVGLSLWRRRAAWYQAKRDRR